MQLVDICANLTHKSFHHDRGEVLRKARQAGLTAMIVPGSSIPDSNEALALAARHPGMLHAAVGVHPHHARGWNRDSRRLLRDLAMHEKAVAIGEAGLDYNRDLSPRADQRLAFERQIQLAAETGLPLLMHQRDAHDDFMALLKPHRDSITRGVVHCFTGDQRMLEDYLALDLHIGITGWICDERRGRHLCGLIPAIPPDRLLLETDAPYLVPRSLRPAPKARRNEPCFLAHIAHRIAECAGTDAAAIGGLGSANAKRFFGLDAKTV